MMSSYVPDERVVGEYSPKDARYIPKKDNIRKYPCKVYCDTCGSCTTYGCIDF